MRRSKVPLGWYDALLFAGFLVVAPNALVADSLYLIANYALVQTELDGSNVRYLYHTGGPHVRFTELAVDSKTATVYWIETATYGYTVIWRLGPNGTRDQVTGEGGFGAITTLAFDEASGMLYYAHNVPEGVDIRRCWRGSTTCTTFLSLRFGSGEGVTLSGLDIDPIEGRVYWAEYRTGPVGRIVSVEMYAGGEPRTLVDSLVVPEDFVLDVDGRKAYWVDWGRRAVERVDLDGTNRQVIAENIDHPTSIAVHRSEGKVYWVDATSEAIERANLDGSGREFVFSIPYAYRLDVAPDLPVGIQHDSWGRIKHLYR